MTAGEGVEIVVVGPATIEALQIGFQCVANGGTVVQFMGTPPGVHLQLSTSDLYFREVRLIPSYSCGPIETRAALAYIAAGIVSAGQVVTHRFPLLAAQEAYRVTAEDKTAVKTLVTFGGADTTASSR
jgi:L-iditol 2-dehydrogenase